MTAVAVNNYFKLIPEKVAWNYQYINSPSYGNDLGTWFGQTYNPYFIDVNQNDLNEWTRQFISVCRDDISTMIEYISPYDKIAINYNYAFISLITDICQLDDSQIKSIILWMNKSMIFNLFHCMQKTKEWNVHSKLLQLILNDSDLISIYKEDEMYYNIVNPVSSKGTKLFETGIYKKLCQIYGKRDIEYSYRDINCRYRCGKSRNTPPMEIDFYIKSRNIAIEYDGLFHRINPDQIIRDFEKNVFFQFHNNIRFVRIHLVSDPIELENMITRI